MFGIFRNTTGEGVEWQLFSVNVKTGAERPNASLDLPASTDQILGFSLHPDGSAFSPPSCAVVFVAGGFFRCCLRIPCSLYLEA